MKKPSLSIIKLIQKYDYNGFLYSATNFRHAILHQLFQYLVYIIHKFILILYLEISIILH
jgi:hypothetical protein